MPEMGIDEFASSVDPDEMMFVLYSFFAQNDKLGQNIFWNVADFNFVIYLIGFYKVSKPK